jgi:beta-glucosidase
MEHRKQVNQATKEILFLKPVCTHNIWGGTRLRDEFGYIEEGDDIGECWGVSAHPKGDGTIREGSFAGMKLSELWSTHRELFGNLSCDRFPLMAKIIDARTDLSIQVHPDGAYAAANEKEAGGKAECWYIMDCPKDATLVIGHNAGNKKELEEMICAGRWSDFIREIPVKKGDFIQLAPGTVHAIKGGFLILETQQNSDITYRVYDYGRLSNGKPRELHVKKSMDVITVPAKSIADSVISTEGLKKNKWNRLYSCEYYTVFLAEISGNLFFAQEYPFLICSVLEGNGSVAGHPIKKGDHFILPNGFGTVDMQGKMRILGSTV